MAAVFVGGLDVQRGQEGQEDYPPLVPVGAPTRSAPFPTAVERTLKPVQVTIEAPAIATAVRLWAESEATYQAGDAAPLP